MFHTAAVHVRHLASNRDFRKPEFGRNACDYDDMYYCKYRNAWAVKYTALSGLKFWCLCVQTNQCMLDSWPACAHNITRGLS